MTAPENGVFPLSEKGTALSDEISPTTSLTDADVDVAAIPRRTSHALIYDKDGKDRGPRKTIQDNDPNNPVV